MDAIGRDLARCDASKRNRERDAARNLVSVFLAGLLLYMRHHVDIKIQSKQEAAFSVDIH